MRDRLTMDKRKIFVRECPTLMSVTKDELRKLYNEIFDRLQDYEVAEEMDQIIVPPCKVGQTVYSQRGCFFLPYEKDINPKEVIPCEAIAIKETKKGKYIHLKPLLIETMGMRSSNEWFPFSAIGKAVFITREEAEQALKGGVRE